MPRLSAVCSGISRRRWSSTPPPTPPSIVPRPSLRPLTQSTPRVRATALPEVHGVLHWTDAGTTSWYEFACAIAADAQAAGLLVRAPEVTPIITAEYPTPAPRPLNSALDLTATASQLALQPVPWRDNLRTTLRERPTRTCTPPSCIAREFRNMLDPTASW
jgi:hypothetical protein